MGSGCGAKTVEVRVPDMAFCSAGKGDLTYLEYMEMLALHTIEMEGCPFIYTTCHCCNGSGCNNSTRDPIPPNGF
jgi:hypothetical protein